MCCCISGADRVYVVDIHIPDNNSDSSASNSCERVPSPPPPVSSRTAASFSDTSVVSRSLITSYVPSLSASSPTRALNKQGSSVEPNRKLPSQNIIQSQEMPSSSVSVTIVCVGVSDSMIGSLYVE